MFIKFIMYRLNPNNKFQIPSGNLNKMFNQDHNQSNQIPTNVIRLDPPIRPTQIIVNEESVDLKAAEDKARLEFEQLVREKFGKIEDILITLKDKQDAIANSNKQERIVAEQRGNCSAGVHGTEPFEPVPQYLRPEPIKVEAVQKTSRTKKTYYNITDNMWGDVKTKFPEIPDEVRSKTFSDGTDYYIDNKNKKIILDNKALLKILNSKK